MVSGPSKPKAGGGKKGPKAKKEKVYDPSAAPWQQGTNVRGITPPGRRLGPMTERRSNAWSASGVAGVRPPGTLKVGDGPAVDWAEKAEKKKLLDTRAARRALDQAKRPGKTEPKVTAPKPSRPTAGFVPNVFADLKDPSDLKAFLKDINDYVTAAKLEPKMADDFAFYIRQSHTPFEIVIAFTLLSAMVGKDARMRRKFGHALERGAKVFFNLARRLDKEVVPPRGLLPETVDAIFHDLPRLAFQVPYAYAADAFCRIFELLRTDVVGDRKLVAFCEELRTRYIEKRSIGDKSLAELFPWERPDWAPDGVDD